MRGLARLFLASTSGSRPDDTPLLSESLVIIRLSRHRHQERREKGAGKGWCLKPRCDAFLVPIRHTAGLTWERGWSHSHLSIKHYGICEWGFTRKSAIVSPLTHSRNCQPSLNLPKANHHRRLVELRRLSAVVRDAKSGGAEPFMIRRLGDQPITTLGSPIHRGHHRPFVQPHPKFIGYTGPRRDETLGGQNGLVLY